MIDQKRLLKIGDVVRLKSGGPWMTVTSGSDDDATDDEADLVECSWFEEFSAASEERWVLREQVIAADALELRQDP